MSLLKKLLNKDKPKVNRKRIYGDVLGNLKFQVEIEGKLVGFFLKNISQSGLAFVPENFENHFLENNEFKAFIECANKKVPFQFIVVHKNEGLIGVRIVSNNIDYGLLIKGYFKLELAAIESSLIPSSKLNKDPDGIPHWICSPDNCELYFVLNEETGLVKYHIGVFGNFIVRNSKKQMSFKQIFSGEVTYTAYKGSDLLRDVNDEFPKDELLKNALSYLSLLKDIPENIKELVTLELQNSLKNL